MMVKSGHASLLSMDDVKNSEKIIVKIAVYHLIYVQLDDICSLLYDAVHHHFHDSLQSCLGVYEGDLPWCYACLEIKKIY